MAFRKRRFFRRRINGKLSRKHYTWVSALNNTCTLTNLNVCETVPLEPFCCPSQAQLVLIDNAVIQSSFQDTIRVVRVHGEIGFTWNFDEVNAALLTLCAECDCDQITALVNDYYRTLYMKAVSGIAVRELHGGDQLTLPRMNPVDDYDFSEGRWKMMRFHTRMPGIDQTIVGHCPTSGNNGVCSAVSGTSPGATTTVCTAFPLPDTLPGTELHQRQFVHPWVWRYNNRCSLKIRENQEPVMSIGWSHFHKIPTMGQLPMPELEMIASLKLLIEVG